MKIEVRADSVNISGYFKRITEIKPATREFPSGLVLLYVKCGIKCGICESAQKQKP